MAVSPRHWRRKPKRLCCDRSLSRTRAARFFSAAIGDRKARREGPALRAAHIAKVVARKGFAMSPMSTFALAAALTAGAVSPNSAFAQAAVDVPAADRGGATCPTKYVGSFLDIGTGACWQCPTAHPARTIFAVTASNACERPAYEAFKAASGPANPTGFLRTDCSSGWFLDIGKGKCYSCAGYNRTGYPIDNARACSKAIPGAWTSATRKGPDGCPAGFFRNGLTPKCYSCPADYSRNLVIADDLTKVNACSKTSSATHDATKAKFDANAASHTASKDQLGGMATQVTTYDPQQAAFDLMARALMRSAVDGTLMYQNGFDAISLMASLSIAAALGYTHAFGYTMTKQNGAYVCRKTWSNAFTGGISAGAGVVVEIGFSKGVTDGASETNGWQVSASYPPVAGGWGLHWNATTGALSTAYVFGPGLALEVGFSEYAHTWAETGNAVACDKITWGSAWATL